MAEKSHLTLRQFTRELDVAYDTGRRWIREGQVKAQRLPGGRLLRIPRSELERILGRTDEDEDED